MKKLLIILFVSLFAVPAIGQVSTCVNINGYWGEWSNVEVYIPENDYAIQGRMTDFIVYHNNSHPSEYIFRVVITNYTYPTKEQIKQHRKNNVWYTYPGYVEYCPQYDGYKKEYTLERFIENFDYGHCYYGGNRVRVNATIKIAPYKKNPEVYNIWFDKYAIGIHI